MKTARVAGASHPWRPRAGPWSVPWTAVVRAWGAPARLSLTRRRLPQLEAGAVGIDPPSETPVLRLLERIDDLDSGRAQLGQQRVKVGDAEVHHERLLRPSEVLGVVIEHSPGRGTARRPLEPLAPPAGDVDPEMFGIPVPKARGLAGALEPPADSRDSLHGRQA